MLDNVMVFRMNGRRTHHERLDSNRSPCPESIEGPAEGRLFP